MLNLKKVSPARKLYETLILAQREYFRTSHLSMSSMYSLYSKINTHRALREVKQILSLNRFIENNINICTSI
jgi:hypothetical protein